MQRSAIRETSLTLATKADLAEFKLGMIKWMAGLALAQVSLSIGLSVKLL
jgi:hypothetical protein